MGSYSLRQIACLLSLLVFNVSMVQPQNRTISQGLFPTKSILSNIIDRFLHNDSNQIIDVNFYLLNATQLLSKWGLSSETHQVRTEDGYWLSMHRIVPKYSNSPPVLLQHGVCMASDSWLLRGREDLAVILHESGYDVWLGNIRGNCYSKQHDYLNTREQPYWDFSWHEHGIFDTPAMIDYVLAITRRPTLSYVGHSMGTTMFYVMASMRPEYNRKINLHVSLAPVGYVSRMKSYQLVFKPFGENKKWFTRALNQNKKYELFERRLANPIAIVCEDPKIRIICNQIAFLILGPDLYQMSDKNIITSIVSYFPAGTSLKTLVHYQQNIESADFKAYDYGHYENKQRYGSYFSPRYNVSSITAPVAMFYSTNDYLSDPTDVKLLAYQLPNLVGLYKVPFSHFNHLDYIFARDSRTLLYNSVLCLLDRYNNKPTTTCNLPTNKVKDRNHFWKE